MSHLQGLDESIAWYVYLTCVSGGLVAACYLAIIALEFLGYFGKRGRS